MAYIPVVGRLADLSGRGQKEIVYFLQFELRWKQIATIISPQRRVKSCQEKEKKFVTSQTPRWLRSCPEMRWQAVPDAEPCRTIRPAYATRYRIPWMAFWVTDHTLGFIDRQKKTCQSAGLFLSLTLPCRGNPFYP